MALDLTWIISITNTPHYASLAKNKSVSFSLLTLAHNTYAKRAQYPEIMLFKEP